jgi:uracil-DNA glycosylase
MIPIPSSCQTCPFYQYKDEPHNGFVPDTIVQGSQVMFLAQNPGMDEVSGHQLLYRKYHGNGEHSDTFTQVYPAPLLGASGKMFNEKFLPLTGLKRDEISLGNAIRCRPGKALELKADSLKPIATTVHLEDSNSDIVNAMKHCKSAHLHIPDSVRIVVAMGRYAQFIMSGIQKEESEYGHRQGVVESWRGYGVDITDWHSNNTVDTTYYHPLTSDRILYFTFHIAALFRDKKYFHATLEDFAKIKQLLNRTWPEKLPLWSNNIPQTFPHFSAFDTEYLPENNQLIRWSLCDSNYNTYCIEAEDTPIAGIPIADNATVLIQNALADLPYLKNIVDMSKVKIEDMMLMHSVLWTGEPHSLDYMCSLYGSVNKYKHLMNDQPQLYSALDAYIPMLIWRRYFIPAFKEDRDSWNVYKKYRLPLVNIIHKAQQSGIKVDTNRLIDVQNILKDRVQSYKEKAQLITDDDKFALGGRLHMMNRIYNIPLPEKKVKQSKRKKKGEITT